MTRKTPGTNVKAVVPTADELNDAKAKREAMNGEAKRAVKASVRHFFGLHKEDNDALINGAVTDELIEKWLVWLGRCEDSTKHVHSTQDFKKGKMKYKDLAWYTIETGPPTFGPHRFAYWLEGKMLPERRDRISGKKGEFITEYAVPNDWERMTEEDWKSLKQETEFELNKDNCQDEMAAFTAMGRSLIGEGNSTDSSAAGVGATVKQEPTAGAVMAEKIEALKSQKDQVLSRMRSINLEVRQMSARAVAKQKDTGKEAHTFFIGECAAIEKITNKAVRALERMCIEGEVAAMSELPKLVKLVESADEKFVEALDWGRKFKFTGDEKAGAKRKKAGD
jgi:hypothetical protein